MSIGGVADGRYGIEQADKVDTCVFLDREVRSKRWTPAIQAFGKNAPTVFQYFIGEMSSCCGAAAKAEDIEFDVLNTYGRVVSSQDLEVLNYLC